MANTLRLQILLHFHHHAPEQAAVCEAFHQAAAHQIGGDQLGRAGKEGLGEGWEVLVDGRGGYRSFAKRSLVHIDKKDATSLAKHSFDTFLLFGGSL